MPTPEETAAADAAAKAKSDEIGKELEGLKAKNAEYEKKIAELSKKPNPEDDPDLKEKVRIEREAKEKKTGETKALERALTFNLKSEDFLKTNGSLLPKDIGDIFKLAQKETYADPIEKDGAIKASIIQSFFSVQENMDLLTPAIKTSLDEYLKLTKTVKQAKAQDLYENVFEPAFEMLKRIKKAEALSKGHSVTDDDDFNASYKNKMMKHSKEVHLGEKS